MADIREQLLKNHQRYQRELSEIQDNWELSDAAKRERTRALFSEASETHSRLTSEFVDGINAAVEENQRKVFAAPKIADGLSDSNKAMDVLLYREALDRTRGIADSADLEAVMEEAALVGDVSLLRAAAFRGYQHPQQAVRQKTIDTWLSVDKDAAKGRGKFMDAAETQQALEEELGTSALTGVPAPEDPQRPTQFSRSMGSGVSEMAGMDAFAVATSTQPPDADADILYEDTSTVDVKTGRGE
jgi:hypothetical protein